MHVIVNEQAVDMVHTADEHVAVSITFAAEADAA
jgi:hypothetical protein